jgi:hypothetical protein
MSLASERMQRSAAHPMRVGETVTLSGLTVTITALTDDLRPRSVRARLDVPLEDPRLVFLEWNEAEEGFRPFRLPGIGERALLKKVDFTKLRF